MYWAVCFYYTMSYSIVKYYLYLDIALNSLLYVQGIVFIYYNKNYIIYIDIHIYINKYYTYKNEYQNTRTSGGE